MKRRSSLYLSKNIVSKIDIDNLYNAILVLFIKYFPDIFSWCKKKYYYNLWNEHKFHESLANARRVSPKKFGYIYDSIQVSYAAKKIMTSEKLLSLVEKFTKIPKNNFICFNSVIRLDPSFDSRNSVDWHYDVYPNSYKHIPEHGVTVQVSFHKTSTIHGTPIFLLESHKINKNKLINSQNASKQSKNSSYKYSFNENLIKKYKNFFFNTNSGDAVIFPMKLIHKSGINTSGKFRISGIFRYYPVNKSTFLPLRENYIPIE